MKLLSARSTSLSYPTDAALVRRFRTKNRDIPAGQTVPVTITLAGTAATSTNVGIDFSPDNGVTWTPGLISQTAIGTSPVFYIPNDVPVRPKGTLSGGTPSVDLFLNG